MNLCRKGLHSKDHPGSCLTCKAARQARYNRTEQGKAVSRRASSKYGAKMPAIKYGAKLLRARRLKALKRRELRRLRGSLPTEG